jgi:DNA-binding protein HU-beta
VTIVPAIVDNKKRVALYASMSNAPSSRRTQLKWWISRAQRGKCLTLVREYVLIARTHADAWRFVPVNKGELVDAIASSASLSKADAESALNSFINAVQGAVAGGDKVTLPGFGTFAPSARAARTGMNPQTREPIQIPASKSVKFTVGSDFKKRVNS